MLYESVLDELVEHRDLSDEALATLLSCNDGEVEEELHSRAREFAVSRFGHEVYLRGLVEWSNVCRNDCLYCGIRRSNPGVSRYTLTKEEILSCAERIYDEGIRTIVLQSGENPSSALSLAGVVSEIKSSWPDVAVTLGLGELPFSTYATLRRAGADRFLLRHETANPSHYARLHPAGMSLEHRLECLSELRRLGFQTGMGMMVGSPYQSVCDLVADIRLIQSFRPEMIGIGPFVPQKDTPFGSFPPGSPVLTLKLYSILRIMLPNALIPSTTALATVLQEGCSRGILAGANVVMPYFTPAAQREAYHLYDNKSSGQLSAIKQELASIGYRANLSRGDYQAE